MPRRLCIPRNAQRQSQSITQERGTNRCPFLLQTMNRQLRCGHFTFDLTRPLVVGVLNVTPDSFSDGGSYVDRDRALEATRLVRELLEQAGSLGITAAELRAAVDVELNGRRGK